MFGWKKKYEELKEINNYLTKSILELIKENEKLEEEIEKLKEEINMIKKEKDDIQERYGKVVKQNMDMSYDLSKLRNKEFITNYNNSPLKEEYNDYTNDLLDANPYPNGIGKIIGQSEKTHNDYTNSHINSNSNIATTVEDLITGKTIVEQTANKAIKIYADGKIEEGFTNEKLKNLNYYLEYVNKKEDIISDY